MAAAAAATVDDFNALIACGVSSRWLWSGPMRFGVTSINSDSDGAYQPSPDGRRLFIVPAIPVAGDVLFEEHDPGDLVAFNVAEPGQWWLRLSVAPVLNPEAVERADFMREALPLWNSPLAWLKAEGQGAVVLDRAINLRLWLGRVPEIIAETLDLGEEIERGLRLPTPTTRVLVREVI